MRDITSTSGSETDANCIAAGPLSVKTDFARSRFLNPSRAGRSKTRFIGKALFLLERAIKLLIFLAGHDGKRQILFRFPFPTKSRRRGHNDGTSRRKKAQQKAQP